MEVYRVIVVLVDHITISPLRLCIQIVSVLFIEKKIVSVQKRQLATLFFFESFIAEYFRNQCRGNGQLARVLTELRNSSTSMEEQNM
jgi:hypothetical protein